MAIDHIVALDCPPKRALGVQGIVDRIKARSRAESALSYARANGDKRAPEAITFKVAIIGPKGVAEERDVAVGGLLQQSAALESHRASCAGCPANHGSPSGFGCYESINYPIQTDTEAWLVSRLPQELSSTAGFLFGKALVDFGWDGEQAASMRANGRTFFESPDQLGVQYDDDIVIGSDVVFHMMFHLGHLGAAHAKLLCLFLGMLPADLPPQRIGAADWMNDLIPIPPEEGQIEQMATFLRACAKSAELGVDLLIDG